MIQNRIRQQQSGGIDTPVVHGTGVFIWPCNGPITSPFGYRTHPIFGTTIYHAGIDIGVDYGTPIHAADGGTVIAAEWYGGYGNAVIIDHGNGLQSLYGHNSSLTVSVGETVSQGRLSLMPDPQAIPQGLIAILRFVKMVRQLIPWVIYNAQVCFEKYE